MKKLFLILLIGLLFGCSQYPNHPADMEEIIYNYCKDSIEHYGEGGDTLRLAKLTPFKWEFLDGEAGPTMGDVPIYNKYLKKDVYFRIGENEGLYIFINKAEIVDHMLFNRRKEKFRIFWNPTPKTSEESEERRLHPELFRQDMTPKDANFYVIPRVENGRTLYQLEPVSYNFTPHDPKNIIYHYCKDSIKQYGIGGDTLSLSKLMPFKWEYLDGYDGSSFGEYNEYLKRGIRHYCGKKELVLLFINQETVVDSVIINVSQDVLRVRWDSLKKIKGKQQEPNTHSNLYRQVFTPKDAYFYVVPIVRNGKTTYALEPVN